MQVLLLTDKLPATELVPVAVKRQVLLPVPLLPMAMPW
jgi:hypothetical protein